MAKIIYQITIRDDGTSKYSSDFNVGWFSAISDDFESEIKYVFNEKMNIHNQKSF